MIVEFDVSISHPGLFVVTSIPPFNDESGIKPHKNIKLKTEHKIFRDILDYLTESDTIRDVIAFPMNSKAQDLMMGAPGNVTPEQLQDVHIKLDLPRDSFTNRISKE